MQFYHEPNLNAITISVTIPCLGALRFELRELSAQRIEKWFHQVVDTLVK